MENKISIIESSVYINDVYIDLNWIPNQMLLLLVGLADLMPIINSVTNICYSGAFSFAKLN